MVKIPFEVGAFLVGGLVWVGLGVGILFLNGFIIVVSCLTLGLVISVWIIIVATNITELNMKRKLSGKHCINQITNNYVSYVDLTSLENTNINTGIRSEGK